MRILLTMLVLLVSTQLMALDINDIEKAIKQKGAKWAAKPTKVWNETKNGSANYLGERLAPPVEFTFMPVKKTTGRRAPDMLDWHDYGGLNYMSPVTNQGKCGSCVAFASIATLEGTINVVNKWPSFNINLSEQHLWSCGGSYGCNSGWTTTGGANALKKVGAPDEACFPYISGAAGEDFACNMTCGNAGQRLTKIKNYESVGGWWISDQDMIDALQTGPIMVAMTVYEDFMSYNSGIYEHVTGKVLGGHAVTLVGYNNIEKYWVIKNSWGPDWGEAGYFRIKMNDDSDVGRGAVKLIIDPYAGAINIANPKDRALLSKEVMIDIEHNIANVTNVRLGLNSNRFRQEYAAVAVGDKKFQAIVNTEEIPDGVYEAQAWADVAGRKESMSVIRELYVLNSNPTMSLAITSPVNGAIVKDRIYIDFAVESSPIPLQVINLKVKAPDGNIKTVSSTNIAAKVQVSWRTTATANGEYELWGEGIIGDYKVETEHLKVTVDNPPTQK